MVTLRWALSQSNNWISAYLIREFSPQSLVKLMHSFGIKSKLDPVVSLCLGPVEVSVSEMVDAYTTFVNKGIKVEPLYVTRIEDNKGNIISTFTPQYTEIISEETSHKMLEMLKAVINEVQVYVFVIVISSKVILVVKQELLKTTQMVGSLV